MQLPNCVKGECVAAATKSFRNLCVVNSPNGRKQHQQRAIKTSLNEIKIPKPKEEDEKKKMLHKSNCVFFSFVRSCVAFLNSFVRFLLAYVRFSNLCVFVEGRIYCLSFYLGYRSMSFSATNVYTHFVAFFFFSSLLTYRRFGSVLPLFILTTENTATHVTPFNFRFFLPLLLFEASNLRNSALLLCLATNGHTLFSLLGIASYIRFSIDRGTFVLLNLDRELWMWFIYIFFFLFLATS